MIDVGSAVRLINKSPIKQWIMRNDKAFMPFLRLGTVGIVVELKDKLTVVNFKGRIVVCTDEMFEELKEWTPKVGGIEE